MIIVIVSSPTANLAQRYGGGGHHQLQGSLATLPTSMPTVTVRGFLNFRTTVDGTVIVFTPSPTASVAPRTAEPIRHTAEAALRPNFAPPQPLPQAPVARPNEIRPTRVPSGQPASYPTGLVTVLGGTVVQGGATTVYETKVIGTYISGKYAQILSSTIKVKPDAPSMVSPTLRPTSTYTPAQQQLRATQQRYPDEEQPGKDDEEESVPNAIVQHRKPHPLRAKVGKLLESSKARHQSARLDRLQLNPMRSRWAKKEAADTEGETSTPNKALMKLRKVAGSKRYAHLAPRQSPMVWMII